MGLGITDVNTRFGGAFPAPAYAALPGRTYPELIVRMAAGEQIEPHVGEFREGRTFTRYYWQLELDEGASAHRAGDRPRGHRRRGRRLSTIAVTAPESCGSWSRGDRRQIDRVGVD